MRPRRVFIDYLRNGRGQTAVGAFSPRARAGVPVSAPISWKEVERGVRSDALTIANLPRRLRAKRDPWRGFGELRQSLPAALRRIGL